MLRLHTDTSRPKAPGNAAAAMDAAIFLQSQPEAEVARTRAYTHYPDGKHLKEGNTGPIGITGLAGDTENESVYCPNREYKSVGYTGPVGDRVWREYRSHRTNWPSKKHQSGAAPPRRWLLPPWRVSWPSS